MMSVLPMMGKVSHGDQQDDKSAHNVTTKVIITCSFNTIFHQCMIAISMVESESLCALHECSDIIYIMPNNYPIPGV